MDSQTLNSISIEVDNISVVYSNGNIALKDASFKLEAGKVCALVGINGSGKSTLFKSIMGFISPTKGRVLIAGMPIKNVLKKNLIAYVPQSEEVDWTFPVTVWDVVMMGRYGHMNFMRIPAKKDFEIAEESLKKVQMLEFKDIQIGELSGGQKKRVFLARALAQEGKIMLLDEPFTGVDIKSENSIISLLKELAAKGHIILVSTHNLGAVPEFCDQVIIINRTVLACGNLTDVFTEQNLALAFGGALRHFRFNESTLQAHDDRVVTVMTDDERPLVFGKDGHLEFSTRAGREDVIEARAESADDK